MVSHISSTLKPSAVQQPLVTNQAGTCRANIYRRKIKLQPSVRGPHTTNNKNKMGWMPYKRGHRRGCSLCFRDRRHPCRRLTTQNFLALHRPFTRPRYCRNNENGKASFLSDEDRALAAAQSGNIDAINAFLDRGGDIELRDSRIGMVRLCFLLRLLACLFRSVCLYLQEYFDEGGGGGGLPPCSVPLLAVVV